MPSEFIAQTVVTGGNGVINVPIPGAAQAGDLIIAFGAAEMPGLALTDVNAYSFGPGVWSETQNSEGILTGPRAAFFCVRKLFAGETDLVLTPLNASATNLAQVVLQVWRGAAQLFTGPVGEYNNSDIDNGYPGAPSNLTPSLNADPTAIIGGNLAFSACVALGAVSITSADIAARGFTNQTLQTNIRIDFRGFTQVQGGVSYPTPIYNLSGNTFWSIFSIGFSGAPERVIFGCCNNG